MAEKMNPQDSRLVHSIILLASIYEQQRKFTDVEREDMRALKVANDMSGPDSFDALSVMNAVGNSYLRARKYPEALDYLNRALALEEKLRGPDSGEIELDSIGQVYLEQGNLEKAEDAFEKLLAAEESMHGPGDLFTTSGLERLGYIHCQMGKYDLGKDEYERKLAIEEKHFGPNSAALGGTLDEIARALRGLGKPDEARALENRRRLLAANQTH